MVQAEEKRISRSERQMTTPLFLLRAQQKEDRNMSRRKRKLRRKAAELIALKVLKKRRRRRRRAGIGGKAARLLAVLAAVPGPHLVCRPRRPCHRRWHHRLAGHRHHRRTGATVAGPAHRRRGRAVWAGQRAHLAAQPERRPIRERVGPAHAHLEGSVPASGVA